MKRLVRYVPVIVGLCCSFVVAQELILESETTLDANATVDDLYEVASIGEDVVLAASIRYTNVMKTMLVARVGPAGVAWSRELPDPASGHYSGEIAIAQGEAVVGASRLPGTGPAGPLRIFRLDGSGAFEWTTDVPGDWYATTPGALDRGDHPQVAVLGDDSVVVACTKGNILAEFWGGVVCVDADGAVLWQTELVETGFNFKVQDVAVAPDGSIRVAGGRYATKGHPQALFVAKILPNGTVDWISTVSGQIGVIFAEFFGTTVHVDTNGDAVLIGPTETMCGLFAITLGRLDEQGVLLWSDEIPDLFCGQTRGHTTHMRSNGSVIVVFSGSVKDFQSNIGAASWTVDGTREWVFEPDGEHSLSFGGGALDTCDNLLFWGGRSNATGCDEFTFATVDFNTSDVTVLESPVCFIRALVSGHANGRFSHIRKDFENANSVIKVAFLKATSLGSPADLNDDGAVGGADLTVLLGEWGVCTGACLADLTGDGIVGGDDLTILLGDWSECP